MANVIDLTNIPADIVITNNFKSSNTSKTVIPVADVKVEDGATAPGATDVISTVNGIQVVASDIKIQMFGTNLWVTLPAGDSLKVTARTSSELLYYISKANSVDFLEITTNGKSKTTESDEIAKEPAGEAEVTGE